MICIAIDGPSASGKSTVSKELAKRFGWIHLDTGALYRGMAFFFIKNHFDFNNSKVIKKNLKNINLEIKFIENSQNIFLNGENITDKIRTNDISMAASKISSQSDVRKFLLNLQRCFAKKYDLIADGRDIGTVIFPDADLKIFLKASPKVRAMRRYNELLNNGQKNVNYDTILKSVQERDYNDSNRKISPLKPANDAVIFDNSEYNFNETINLLSKIILKKLLVRDY